MPTEFSPPRYSPSDLNRGSVCYECSAFVMSTTQHTDWHRDLFNALSFIGDSLTHISGETSKGFRSLIDTLKKAGVLK